MSRFAAVVIAKLRRLITEYTLVRRDETMTSWTEGAVRQALIWLLEWVSARFDRFPWMQYDSRTFVAREFDLLVQRLRAEWLPHLNGDLT